MTKDEIREFMPSLSSGDIVNLEAAANADSEEGVEWLPYYKMALARLAECAGALRSLADIPLDEEKSMTHAQHVLRNAARLFYEHLLFGGIGPRRDPDVIRRVEKTAAEAMAKFIDEGGEPCSPK